MPYAREIKKGNIVEINNQLYIARNIEAQNPSSRGASTLYKIRFKQIPGGQKLEGSYKGDDNFKDVDLQRCQVSMLYREDNMITFMDLEDYSQYMLNVEELESQMLYLQDGMEGLMALLVNGNPVAIELPQTVIMTVMETTPVIKGASAAARTKPAKMASGLEVQVPEYLAEGEQIKINTETGKFMSRA